MELLNNNKEQANGGNSMNNDFGVGDILTGRGLGLGGFGYGGCNAGYGSPYANLATIQHGIANVSQNVEDQADCTRQIVAAQVNSVDKSLTNLERNNSFQRICDDIQRLNNQRGQDMLYLQTQMSNMAAENAKCCCDTKLLIKDTTIENLRSEQQVSQTSSIISAIQCGNQALMTGLQQVIAACAPKCCPT